MWHVALKGLEGGGVGQEIGAAHEVGAEGVKGPGADRGRRGIHSGAGLSVAVQAEGDSYREGGGAVKSAMERIARQSVFI